jgi:hypothetical protein
VAGQTIAEIFNHFVEKETKVRTFILVVSVGFVTILAGCLEDIGSAYNDLTKGWFTEDTALAATIAEIDAVSKLRSDSAKFEGFKAIAAREGLRAEAQARLVKPVYESLYSDSDKEEVLLALIDNPGFSSGAKLVILTHLDKLASEKSRIRVVKAINKRGLCANDNEQIEIEIEVREKQECTK